MTEKVGDNSELTETAIPESIVPITYRKVNCFLVKIKDGYILIDSGYANQRKKIEQELENAGCKPGGLKLILLTHGDFDHVGNSAYFREKYGAKIAMHQNDSGMVERGDMFWNRSVFILIKIIIRIMIFLLRFNLKKADRFKPDIYVEDGQDLSEYGFDAKVIHLPGHSKGSIGILTAEGDLFCGDLLTNWDKPEKNSLVDVQAEFDASIEKLKNLQITTVYPGHGKPFPMELFMRNS